MKYLNISPTQGHLAVNKSTWTSEEVFTKVIEFITSVFVWITSVWGIVDIIAFTL